jgi:hypothetical protein
VTWKCVSKIWLLHKGNQDENHSFILVRIIKYPHGLEWTFLRPKPAIFLNTEIDFVLATEPEEEMTEARMRLFY